MSEALKNLNAWLDELETDMKNRTLIPPEQTTSGEKIGYMLGRLIDGQSELGNALREILTRMEAADEPTSVADLL